MPVSGTKYIYMCIYTSGKQVSIGVYVRKNENIYIKTVKAFLDHLFISI